MYVLALPALPALPVQVRQLEGELERLGQEAAEQAVGAVYDQIAALSLAGGPGSRGSWPPAVRRLVEEAEAR